MTDIELARECGAIRSGSFDAVKCWTFTEGGLSAYAERIRADERERCAKVCEELRDDHVQRMRSDENFGDLCAVDGIDCQFVFAWNGAAAAIRSSAGRGK